MAVFLRFFVPRRSLFFRDERGERGKNKVGPKNLQCDLELIECGGLAIGKTCQSGHTLISDKMLVWTDQFYSGKILSVSSIT